MLGIHYSSVCFQEQEENNLLMEQIKSEMEELHNSVSEGYVLMNSVISH